MAFLWYIKKYMPLCRENPIIQTGGWNTNSQVHTSTRSGINTLFTLLIPSRLNTKNIRYRSVIDTLAISHRKLASSLVKSKFKMFHWHLKLALPTPSFLPPTTYPLRWKSHIGNMGHWFSAIPSAPISMGCAAKIFSWIPISISSFLLQSNLVSLLGHSLLALNATPAAGTWYRQNDGPVKLHSDLWRTAHAEENSWDNCGHFPQYSACSCSASFQIVWYKWSGAHHPMLPTIVW